MTYKGLLEQIGKFEVLCYKEFPDCEKWFAKVKKDDQIFYIIYRYGKTEFEDPLCCFLKSIKSLPRDEQEAELKMFVYCILNEENACFENKEDLIDFLNQIEYNKSEIEKMIEWISEQC